MMTNITEEPHITPDLHPSVVPILVMAVTFVVGVPGNLLVLWITSTKIKLTVNTVWFWNLAVADIVCCLFLPLSIAQHFYTEWLYGAAMCKVIPVIVHLNMFASVFTLVAISIDRCILVVQPVWAQNNRSLRMAWILCAVIWMLALLMCLPAVLYRNTFIEYNKTHCGYELNFGDNIGEPRDSNQYEFIYMDDMYGGLSFLNFTDYQYLENNVHPTDFTITLTRMIFGFLIPLIIISACYLRLAFKVQRNRFLKVSQKTNKVVLGIVTVFFITWAPYHIIGMVGLYFHDSMLETLDDLSIALAYFNSCVNPILYVFIGKDMRRRVSRSIGGLMESALSDDISKSTERTRNKTLNQDSVVL